VDGVKALMEQAKKSFPPDMDYVIALDTTQAVREGIKEIVHTLFEALVLVILVVFIFLQGWRATLIPALAVPVSLIGTFAFFPLLGFSLNTIALMGLVLAIGIVVDDAIVVVEAVEHHIEHGLSPKDATLKAMEEVTGPVVATTLSLAAVFIPTIFIPGITGKLYQQFAITIAVSVIISSFNALTLTPALSAMLLKPKKESRGLLSRFYRWFNDALRPHHQRLCQVVRDFYPEGGDEPPLSGSGGGTRRPFGRQTARRFPPGRRPGLSVCRGAVARRLLPAAHQ
jgi:hydrophobic/amphiphilic exporter-1 (mainly G- bacteria), HAE1 family